MNQFTQEPETSLAECEASGSPPDNEEDSAFDLKISLKVSLCSGSWWPREGVAQLLQY